MTAQQKADLAAVYLTPEQQALRAAMRVVRLRIKLDLQRRIDIVKGEKETTA